MIFGLLLGRKQIDSLFAFSLPLLIEHMLKKGKKKQTQCQLKHCLNFFLFRLRSL